MKIDGRTLSHEASETIRQMAVKRVLEGESPSAVMKSYGLCRTTIYPWLRAQEGRRSSAAIASVDRPAADVERQREASSAPLDLR
jgi:hypothetical protein